MIKLLPQRDSNSYTIQSLIRSEDRNLNILILAVWGYNILVFIRAFLSHFVSGELFNDLFIPFIYGMLVILAFPEILRRIKIQDLILLLSLLGIYLSHYIIFPQNSAKLNEYLYQFSLCSLPYLIYGILIDIKRLHYPLYLLSIVIVIIQTLYSIVYLTHAQRSMGENGDEDMALAYMTLFFVTYVILGTLHNPNIIGIITSIIGSFLLLGYGTRGPIICIMFFAFTYFMFVSKNKHKIKIGFICLALLGLLIWKLDVIIPSAINFFSAIGLHTRILEKMLMGEMIGYANSSGRDTIATTLLEALKHSDFWGYGIGGTWQFGNIYAHNVVLDFLISFGIVPGMFFIITLLIFFVIGFFRSKDALTKSFFLLLFSCGFFKMFMSNVFFKEPYFYFLIGYTINIIRTYKNTNNYNL